MGLNKCLGFLLYAGDVNFKRNIWEHPSVRKIFWKRKWQPAPVVLLGKSHGQRSLAGCSLWSCKKSDTTKHAHTHAHTHTHRWEGELEMGREREDQRGLSGSWFVWPCGCCAQSFSQVRLCAAPWTVACQDPLSLGILQARTLEWVAQLPLLQGIFPTQGLKPDLLHCRQILYHLSYQGSPRILAWVAYPFSRGPDLGIELGSPSLQVDSLTAELPGKPQSSHCTSLSMQLFFIVEKLLLQFLDCIPGKNYSGTNCRSFEDANKNSQRIEINGIIGKCWMLSWEK